MLTTPAEAAIVFSDGFESETVNDELSRWASYETWGSRNEDIVNGELRKTYNGKFSEPGVSLHASRISWYLSGFRNSNSVKKYAGEDYVICFDVYRRGDKNSSYTPIAYPVSASQQLYILQKMPHSVVLTSRDS